VPQRWSESLRHEARSRSQSGKKNKNKRTRGLFYLETDRNRKYQSIRPSTLSLSSISRRFGGVTIFADRCFRSDYNTQASVLSRKRNSACVAKGLRPSAIVGAVPYRWARSSPSSGTEVRDGAAIIGAMAKPNSGTEESTSSLVEVSVAISQPCGTGRIVTAEGARALGLACLDGSGQKPVPPWSSPRFGEGSAQACGCNSGRRPGTEQGSVQGRSRDESNRVGSPATR